MENIKEWNENFANAFIDRCIEKFGWKDLSNDVIMDLGCGEEGFCGKAILDKFPDVEKIIAFDSDPKVLRNFRLRNERKIEFALADIEIRDSIRCYEMHFTKVISTQVFHQLKDKEEGFRNMYDLLIPGGEAAVLFCIKSGIYDWLTEMLNNPKWKEFFKFNSVPNFYDIGIGADHYKEMVERIGYHVIECSEERVQCPYTSDESCKEKLYEMWEPCFKVPPEMIEEFKEDCFQVFLRVGDRSEEEKPCCRSTFLTLLLTRPTEDASSD